MTKEKKTCGDCGWSEPFSERWQLTVGDHMIRCKVMEAHVPKAAIECSTRKAYRVLRDEVRKTRALLRKVLDTTKRFHWPYETEAEQDEFWEFMEATEEARVLFGIVTPPDAETGSHSPDA